MTKTQYLCLVCCNWADQCKCKTAKSAATKAKRAAIKYDIVLWSNALELDVQSFELTDWKDCKEEYQEYTRAAIELELEEEDMPYLTVYKYREGESQFEEISNMAGLPKKVQSTIAKILE